MSGEKGRLYAAYPAEAECILLELNEGQYVSPDESRAERARLAAGFAKRLRAEDDARQREEEDEQRAWQAEERVRERNERQAWGRLNGKP